MQIDDWIAFLQSLLNCWFVLSTEKSLTSSSIRVGGTGPLHVANAFNRTKHWWQKLLFATLSLETYHFSPHRLLLASFPRTEFRLLLNGWTVPVPNCTLHPLFLESWGTSCLASRSLAHNVNLDSKRCKSSLCSACRRTDDHLWKRRPPG